MVMLALFDIFKGDYEIYCPRCDMFFNNKEDYQDHLLIRQFKESVLGGIAQRLIDRGVNDIAA